MKLYICGPMSGYSSYNYPSFEFVQELLEHAGYEVLNPIVNKGPEWNDYMRQSIAQLIQADGVCALERAELSAGAHLEIQIAHALRIPVLPDWVWVGRAGS